MNDHTTKKLNITEKTHTNSSENVYHQILWKSLEKTKLPTKNKEIPYKNASKTHQNFFVKYLTFTYYYMATFFIVKTFGGFRTC